MIRSPSALFAALCLASPAALAGPASHQAPSSGMYRSLFERGLAQLEAGANEEAAQSFRAAGELAPDAPVWKAYLDRAEGREPDLSPELTPSALGAWSLVPHQASDVSVDPTGERLLSGYDPATLWDARTGERIAAISHRRTGDGWRWQFDTLGRVLVGLGRTTDGRFAPAGIDAMRRANRRTDRR